MAKKIPTKQTNFTISDDLFERFQQAAGECMAVDELTNMQKNFAHVAATIMFVQADAATRLRFIHMATATKAMPIDAVLRFELGTAVDAGADEVAAAQAALAERPAVRKGGGGRRTKTGGASGQSS